MFRAILATKLTKIANMRQKNILHQNFNMGIKNPKFNAEESSKSPLKKHLSPKTFAHSNKRQKIHFSPRFSLITDFFEHFFHRIRNGHRIVRFFWFPYFRPK